MKFLADMGISPATVEFLRCLGYAAVHLHEQRLDRLDDVSILAKAKAEDRILLTHDLDFGDLIAASGACLPSVVIFRLRNMQPNHVNRYLQRVLTQHTQSLTNGAIISVGEGRMRIRLLPLRTSE